MMIKGVADNNRHLVFKSRLGGVRERARRKLPSVLGRLAKLDWDQPVKPDLVSNRVRRIWPVFSRIVLTGRLEGHVLSFCSVCGCQMAAEEIDAMHRSLGRRFILILVHVE